MLSPCLTQKELTPLSRVLEKLIVTQLVKEFPACYGIRKFITMFTRPRHWSVLSRLHPFHILLTYFPKIQFGINFPSTSRSSEWYLRFRFSDQNHNQNTFTSQIESCGEWR